jgi:GntR family transcriptional regulator
MNLPDDTWSIEFHSGIPVYKQIVHLIQAAIADDRLKEDDQLPTVRALHKQLNVNPNTVVKAYRELELGGLITTQRGSGCYVAPRLVPPKLSAKDKKVKVDELSFRLAAEARSHGISLETLIQNLTQIKAHG